jgi:hypothetical protein
VAWQPQPHGTQRRAREQQERRAPPHRQEKPARTERKVQVPPSPSPRAERSNLTLVRTLRLGLRAAFTTLVVAFPVGSFTPQLLPAAPSAVQRAVQGLRLVPHGGRWNKKEEGELWLSMAPKKRGAPPKEPCEPSEPEQGAGGAKRSKQVRTWFSARN